MFAFERGISDFYFYLESVLIFYCDWKEKENVWIFLFNLPESTELTWKLRLVNRVLPIPCRVCALYRIWNRSRCGRCRGGYDSAELYWTRLIHWTHSYWPLKEYDSLFHDEKYYPEGARRRIEWLCFYSQTFNLSLVFHWMMPLALSVYSKPRELRHLQETFKRLLNRLKIYTWQVRVLRER